MTSGILPFLAALKMSGGQQQSPPPPPDPSQAVAPMPDVSQLPVSTQGQPPIPDALPPQGETKGHKLLRILQGGLMGGLSGLASNAQTYAATGRNAGFGGGLGAGFGGAQGSMLPFQQQERQNQLRQQQAQTRLTEQQGDMVQTPYGMLPVTLAKMIFPASIKAGAGVTEAQIGAQSRQNVAQTQQETQEKIHRYIPVQGVGLFDSQTRQVMPGSSAGITVTPEIAADHNLPQEFIGKPMTMQQLAAVQRSDVFQNSPMMTAQGPVVINRKNATAKPVTGPGGQTFSPPALASPLQVADVNNPGQTITKSAGQAIAEQAPGVASASVTVPKKAAEAEVPTRIGDKKVAFQTMLDHAVLLRSAATALRNGDSRTLAGLANKFNTEFGSPDVTNFDAIANAYNHEVSDVVAKGHITDREIQTGGATMPSNANLATIDKVLDSYEALAKSKMANLNKQKQNAVNQSQPNKGKEIQYKIVNGQLVKQP